MQIFGTCYRALGQKSRSTGSLHLPPIVTVLFYHPSIQCLDDLFHPPLTKSKILASRKPGLTPTGTGPIGWSKKGRSAINGILDRQTESGTVKVERVKCR